MTQERLFSGKFVWPLTLAFLFAFFNQMSGINAIIYYGPGILESAGLPIADALGSQVIIGLVNVLFTLILLSQCSFYFASFLGFLLESKKIKIKVFFIPYYFSLMNYAAMAGAIRYFKGKQSAAWEKSKRK